MRALGPEQGRKLNIRPARRMWGPLSSIPAHTVSKWWLNGWELCSCRKIKSASAVPNTQNMAERYNQKWGFTGMVHTFNPAQQPQPLKILQHSSFGMDYHGQLFQRFACLAGHRVVRKCGSPLWSISGEMASSKAPPRQSSQSLEQSCLFCYALNCSGVREGT